MKSSMLIKRSLFFVMTLLLTFTFAVISCNSDDDDDAASPGEQINTVDENAVATEVLNGTTDLDTIEGVYTDGDIIEVAEDATVTLKGTVVFDKGSLLRVLPGATIKGDTASLSTLIIGRGAKISAVGTVAKPITFTSGKATGSRAWGDWGGIVINGWADINAGEQAVGEGNSGLYGGSNDADNSGTIKYVRVFFAGYPFTATNELNGVCFQGVGSGTTVDYLQVHRGKDDGIEMFGGTVNLKHLICTGNEDDQVDCTLGWRGKGQFIVAVPLTGCDKVFEHDNNEEDYFATPNTNPVYYNVTGIIGAATHDVTRGLHLRRGTHADYNNSYFSCEPNNTSTEAVYIEGNNTVINLNYCVFENVVAPGYLVKTEATPATVNVSHITTTASPTTALISAASFASFDALQTAGAAAFVPQTGADNSAVTGATPPNDGFFDTTATFIGAVQNSANNWLAGWTEYPNN